MHSLGPCKTNHGERSKRLNSTNQSANNFCLRSRAGTQGESMFGYDFLWGRKGTKTYSEFHLKWPVSQRGHRDRKDLSAGTVATKETRKPKNRVLLEFYCLVVLFLVVRYQCLGTYRRNRQTRKGNILFPLPTWIFSSHPASTMIVLSTLSDIPDWSVLEIIYSGLNTRNVEWSLAKIKGSTTGYSPHVRESNNVLDSGFRIPYTGSQSLPVKLGFWTQLFEGR